MKSIRFGFVFLAFLASFSVISGYTNESKGTSEYDFDEVLHFEFIARKSSDLNDSLLRFEIEKMLYTRLPNELDRYGTTEKVTHWKSSSRSELRDF